MISEVDDEISEESDTSCEGLNLSKVARISSAVKCKSTFLYDTGASHDFARDIKDFVTIQKLSKPFRFDQAIGNSVLTQQGTIRAKIGALILDLTQTLYSPDSSCNIISAVRLKREHKIVAAVENKLLVKVSDNRPDIPIARLVDKDGVLFIKPLKTTKHESLSRNIAAPGIARLPLVTNAQRWHQRLGHIGQQILKKQPNTH